MPVEQRRRVGIHFYQCLRLPVVRKVGWWIQRWARIRSWQRFSSCCTVDREAESPASHSMDSTSVLRIRCLVTIAVATLCAYSSWTSSTLPAVVDDDSTRIGGGSLDRPSPLAAPTQTPRLSSSRLTVPDDDDYAATCSTTGKSGSKRCGCVWNLTESTSSPVNDATLVARSSVVGKDGATAANLQRYAGGTAANPSGG